MAHRKLGFVLRALLLWVGLTGIVAWLPLLRSVMDGESYAWGAPLWGIEFRDEWPRSRRILMGPTLAALPVQSYLFRFCTWRRGWDSNPRLSFPNTRFPSVLLKPLGHLSGKNRVTEERGARQIRRLFVPQRFGRLHAQCA